MRREGRVASLSLPFFAVAVALEKTDSLPRPSLRRTGHLRVKICSMAHNRLCRSGCSSRWFSVPRPLLYASSSLDIKAASTYASWIAPRFKQRYEADNGDKFRSGAMKSSFIASSIFFYFLSLLFCLHLVLDHEESEEKFPFTEFPEERNILLLLCWIDHESGKADRIRETFFVFCSIEIALEMGHGSNFFFLLFPNAFLENKFRFSKSEIYSYRKSLENIFIGK